MKTGHQIARELLALPDEEFHVEMWCPMEGYETKVSYYEANDGGVIIHQERIKPSNPTLAIETGKIHL